MTSKDRAILKMRGVNFKYPTAETRILNDVSLQVSLNSRVAVLGPNGAGKSTLIKLLTGERLPQGRAGGYSGAWTGPHPRHGGWLATLLPPCCRAMAGPCPPCLPKAPSLRPPTDAPLFHASRGAGELEAESGLVWKHPNLRVAYVAQHAFHHIENHLDMTPNQYIQWRYATGEDRESLDKVSRKVRVNAGLTVGRLARQWASCRRIQRVAFSGGCARHTVCLLLRSWVPAHEQPLPPLRPSPLPSCPQLKEEEEKKMAEIKVVDGVKRVVEKLLGRRKQKRGYEYEVQWKGEVETSWLTRDRLEEMGFQKMLTDIDMKVRARGRVAGWGWGP